MLHSTPEMNALSYEADTKQAQAALNRGESYTPALAPSVPMFPSPATPDLTVSPPAPAPVPQPIRQPHAVAPVRVVMPSGSRGYADAGRQPRRSFPCRPWSIPRLSSPTTNRSASSSANGAAGFQGPTSSCRRRSAPLMAMQPTRRIMWALEHQRARRRRVTPASLRSDEAPGRVLVPAGRGVFAHPILALSSDQSSPVVMAGR